MHYVPPVARLLDAPKGVIEVAVVMLALWGVASAERAAVDVQAVVAQVQARLDSATDLRADVTQEALVAALDRTIASEGTVAFKRPGRMRWSFGGDEPQVIVGDGKTVWFYQPEDEQVLRAPLDSVFRSSTPVSFLTGVGKIAEDFDVSIEAEGSTTVVLDLDPRRGGGDFGRLRLVVDRTTFDIVEARVTDALGNITTLRFSNLRRNTGVDDREFEFEPPPGVDVIEAPLGR